MTPKQLWRPSPERVERAAITRFAEHLGRCGSYEALWRWSVEELEEFWAAVVDFFAVRFDTAGESVLGLREMPGAQWFPGSRLSYAQHIFRGKDPRAVRTKLGSGGRQIAPIDAVERLRPLLIGSPSESTDSGGCPRSHCSNRFTRCSQSARVME